jgi:hypothetical protein
VLEYIENTLYFMYIPYLVDIVIFSIYGGDLITILVFTLNPINRDLCIVNKDIIYVEGPFFQCMSTSIESNNLSQHLRGSEREPLPWSTRVQIAWDSARGLEIYPWAYCSSLYPRDIKSANFVLV